MRQKKLAIAMSAAVFALVSTTVKAGGGSYAYAGSGSYDGGYSSDGGQGQQYGEECAEKQGGGNFIK